MMILSQKARKTGALARARSKHGISIAADAA